MNEETKKTIETVRKFALPTLGWLSVLGLVTTGATLAVMSVAAVAVFYEPLFFGLTFLSGAIMAGLGVFLLGQRLFAVAK